MAILSIFRRDVKMKLPEHRTSLKELSGRVYKNPFHVLLIVVRKAGWNGGVWCNATNEYGAPILRMDWPDEDDKQTTELESQGYEVGIVPANYVISVL
jgi:hypothetical protein